MSVRVYIDADACPVREETYKVARRHGVPVTVVANQWLRTPPDVAFERVSDDFDAADDWIAERADPEAVVITSDILLADRVLKQGARVLSPNGREMDDATIGSQIAVRAIMTDLRDSLASKGTDPPGAGGPAPFTDRDRSRFLEALHLMLERMRRR
ncbi:MAG: YaiI/YqxD family protein [Litorimonas sp.]